MPSLSASMATAAALGLLFLAAPRPAAAGVVWDDVYAGFKVDGVASSVAVDDKGYSCTCGYFMYTGGNNTSFDIGQFTLPLTGLESPYIAKRDPNGNVLWAKTFTGDAWTECYDVAIDEKGNCVAVGASGSSEIVAGSFNLTNPNAPSGRRLSEEGNQEWKRQSDAARRRLSGDGPYGYGVNAEGHHLGGSATTSGVNVAEEPITFPPVAWIAVFSNSGTILDAQLLAAEGVVTFLGAVELKKGKAYVVGETIPIDGQESYALNGFNLWAYGGGDMLLARFDYLKSEKFDWVVAYGGDEDDYLYTSTMSNNKWFVGGDAKSDFVEGFGKNGDQVVDTDGGNLFSVLAEVSMKNGQIISYTNFGGEVIVYNDEVDGSVQLSNVAIISEIAADKQGNLYVVGKTEGAATIGFDKKGNEITFDNGAIHTPGANETTTDDAFIIKFKPSLGKTGWFVEFGNTWGNSDSFERLRGVAIGPKGYPYAYFYSDTDTSVELDNALTVTNGLPGDGIGVTAIVKISPKTGEIVEGVQAGYSLYTTLWLDVDKYGYVYAVGGAVDGDMPPAALKVCGDTLNIDPGFFGLAQVKWSTLSCSAAKKCTPMKGCF